MWTPQRVILKPSRFYAYYSNFEDITLTFDFVVPFARQFTGGKQYWDAGGNSDPNSVIP